jgi:hypothetical protein
MALRHHRTEWIAVRGRDDIVIMNSSLRSCLQASRRHAGYSVTVTAGLISYPLDTIRRRMMMTSGGTMHMTTRALTSSDFPPLLDFTTEGIEPNPGCTCRSMRVSCGSAHVVLVSVSCRCR